MLLMLLNGILSTSMTVSGKLLKDMQWPYFRIMCVSTLMVLLTLCARIVATRSQLPECDQLKWLGLRGVFGASTFILMISAVRMGASPGDAASLASINIVIAALLGRVFLGEQLRWTQGIAVVFSLLGSVLITRPALLFGGRAEATSFSGLALASMSGLTQASLYICARKSSKSSLLMLNLSPALFCALVFGILPVTPFVDDYSLAPVVRSPLWAIALVTTFFLIAFGAMATNSAASSWCPAAVSATTSTGSKMVSGYIAQSLLLGRQIEPLTICGAALMLIAVIIMAAARLPGRRAVDSSADAATESQATDDHIDHMDDDEIESIASFIAAEFVELAPHEKTVRHRRGPDVAASPAAQQIGAALSAVAASA